MNAVSFCLLIILCLFILFTYIKEWYEHGITVKVHIMDKRRFRWFQERYIEWMLRGVLKQCNYDVDKVGQLLHDALTAQISTTKKGFSGKIVIKDKERINESQS